MGDRVYDLTVSEVGEASSASCVALRVRRMSRIITRIYDDALRPLGLTASQFTLLTAIAQQDGVTAAEIGLTLDIEKSTLSRNLKRLEAVNYMTMDPPAGRHGRGLHLTADGEAAIMRAFPVWQSTQGRVAEVLGDQSTKTFDELLIQAEQLLAA